MLSVYKNLRIFVPDVLKFFNDVLGDSFQSRDLILNFIIIFKFFYFLIFLFMCLFIWLCQVWSSIFIAGYGSCIMWDPVPRPGPPALWAWSLNCWTTREVPNFIISLILYSLSFAHWGNYLFSLTVPLSHHPPPCPLPDSFVFLSYFLGDLLILSDNVSFLILVFSWFQLVLCYYILF